MKVFVLIRDVEHFGCEFEEFVAVFSNLKAATLSDEVAGLPREKVFPHRSRRHPMGWRKLPSAQEWLYCRMDTKTVGCDGEDLFIREVEVRL